MISSSAKAGGLEHARRAGIATAVIDRKERTSDEAFQDAYFTAIRAAGVKYVVMGGFLKYVPIPPDFENRVINIHPALIPAFCGKGMYGLRVHQAVLDYGVKLTGCTVHFVDNQYDHGPISCSGRSRCRLATRPNRSKPASLQPSAKRLPEALRLLSSRESPRVRPASVGVVVTVFTTTTYGIPSSAAQACVMDMRT